MLALRYYGIRDMRLVDVPEPEPGNGEVKIKIRQCGICGTDQHEYVAGPISLSTKPHPVSGKMIPNITHGHEFAGELVKIGAGVTGWNVGDRVAVSAGITCGQCSFCKSGKPMQCVKLVTFGAAIDGGMSEYVVAPAGNLYRMPEGTSYEVASLCDPMGITVRGVRRAKIGLGDKVAILGMGPIGLFALQLVILAGASSTIAIDPIAMRRDLAIKLGATVALDPADTNLKKVIAGLTEGLKADITMECSGDQKAMLMAPTITAAGGTICVLGAMVGTCAFPFWPITWREQTIVTSMGYTPYEFALGLELLATQKVKGEPLITDRIKLRDIVEKGFNVLAGPERADHMKIVVAP